MMIKILQNKIQERYKRFKNDQEIDNNFKREFKTFKKIKFKKRTISKESIEISNSRS